MLCVQRLMYHLHGPSLQAMDSFLAPTQSFPFPWRGGLVQVRVRTLTPLPQITLQAENGLQSEKPPSTAVKEDHEQKCVTEDYAPSSINPGRSYRDNTRGGGGDPHMKVVRMLVVSLRGVHFGFWSHLGCSGENVIIFSREAAKKYKNTYLICIFLIRFIYSIHIIQVFYNIIRRRLCPLISFVCVLTWSLLGVKKSLGHAQIDLF